LQRLSVVIPNYNYERYVATAIESALALRWDDVEVVVVDDGSTDGSPAIIESYSDRVKVLLGDNGTQRVAINRGFAMTTGDVVIFLDSDDVLPPDLPAALARVWRPVVSKAQFRMQRIDEEGTPIGAPFPAYDPVPTPADVRTWMSRTSAYPTPPGSGNAYARAFLDKIFPIGPEVGDFADSACLAAAPLFGDVVTVPDVVVGYRRHGANDSNLLNDGRRFAREVARARARWRYAQAESGIAAERIDERPLFRGRELLELRVAASRATPGERPLPGDNRLLMMRDAVRAPWHPGPESLRRRLISSCWCVATLLAPAPAVHKLLTARYGRHR
jgi:glycosyltransferase involved in cell wall biosynthesis